MMNHNNLHQPENVESSNDNTRIESKNNLSTSDFKNDEENISSSDVEERNLRRKIL